LKAVVTFATNPDVTEGRVIDQDPAAQTTLSRGDSVNLVVSQGEVRATVPELVGLLLPDARKAITDAQLIVGKITRQNSDRPNNEVLETNPKPGTKTKLNTKVDLIVSNGVALEEVPNVVGLPYSTAYATVTQAGFLVPAPSQEISDQYPPGYVLRQVPPGGSRLSKGSNVTFVLTAAGDQPQPTPTPVPVGPTPTPVVPTPTPAVTPAPAIQSRER
jgi:serine/threonine-protein kinase